jgi:hypothetical protein
MLSGARREKRKVVSSDFTDIETDPKYRDYNMINGQVLENSQVSKDNRVIKKNKYQKKC